MSDIITTPDKSVTDSLGRRIVLRVLDPADMLDLLEAAGAASSNVGWVRYASVIASVSVINDVPVPFATKKSDILAIARKLGNEGFAAVGKYLFGDDETPGADQATVGMAKN